MTRYVYSESGITRVSSHGFNHHIKFNFQKPATVNPFIRFRVEHLCLAKIHVCLEEKYRARCTDKVNLVDGRNVGVLRAIDSQPGSWHDRVEEDGSEIKCRQYNLSWVEAGLSLGA